MESAGLRQSLWGTVKYCSERLLNSYKLETLDGQPVEGEFHARRLRGFVPREGTELAEQQKEVETRRLEELSEDADSERENREKEPEEHDEEQQERSTAE